MPEYTTESFTPLLNKLVKTPEYFTQDDLKLAFEHLFTAGVLFPVQISAFLTALHIHRVERKPEALAAAAEILRNKSLKLDVQDYDADFIVDIVGTGGDGHNTFNVSTTAAIVAAGAGARVIKHGNRASTSSSGSADLLESLGCLFTPPTPGIPFPLPHVPFTFILAPHYHPSLAMVAPCRKYLPFRTMFNVLGPLINPARPRGMVIGAAEPEIGAAFAQSLLHAGVERALVVCGYEKLDEISCAGPSWAWDVQNGEITERVLHPEQFGVKIHPLSAVAGGTPQENARTFKTLLTSGENTPKELQPILDFVLINASALLVVAGIAEDYKHGTVLARQSVISGSAWNALEQFRDGGKCAAAAD